MTPSDDDQVDATLSAEALKASFGTNTPDTTHVMLDGTRSARSADSFSGFPLFPLMHVSRTPYTNTSFR